MHASAAAGRCHHSVANIDLTLWQWHTHSHTVEMLHYQHRKVGSRAAQHPTGQHSADFASAATPCWVTVWLEPFPFLTSQPSKAGLSCFLAGAIQQVQHRSGSAPRRTVQPAPVGASSCSSASRSIQWPRCKTYLHTKQGWVYFNASMVQAHSGHGNACLRHQKAMLHTQQPL